MNYQLLHDFALMKEIREGSLDALGVLYERHVEKVSHYFFWLCRRDQLLADDLVQVTFLRVFDKAYQFKEESAKAGNAVGWILRIAYRVFLNSGRGLERLSGLDELEMVIGETDENVVADNEQIVRKYLEALSKRDREVLELKYFAGLSYQEISDQTEDTEEALRARVSRALRSLRRLAEHEGNELLGDMVGTEQGFAEVVASIGNGAAMSSVSRKALWNRLERELHLVVNRRNRNNLIAVIGTVELYRFIRLVAAPLGFDVEHLPESVGRELSYEFATLRPRVIFLEDDGGLVDPNLTEAGLDGHYVAAVLTEGSAGWKEQRHRYLSHHGIGSALVVERTVDEIVKVLRGLVEGKVIEG